MRRKEKEGDRIPDETSLSSSVLYGIQFTWSRQQIRDRLASFVLV